MKGKTWQMEGGVERAGGNPHLWVRVMKCGVLQEVQSAPNLLVVWPWAHH